MSRILAVDDEKDMLRLLHRIITTKTSYEVTTISEPEKVIPIINKEFFDLILLDLRMPGINGMELLEKIKERDPDIGVIIITAYGTIETAVKAIKLGAYDFITKPFKWEQIVVTLNRAMELQNLKKENRRLKRELEVQKDADFIIGNTERMQSIYRYALQIAPTSAPVVITGETGTGKELMARLIHKHSGRKGSFVAINCSAFPENLIESEMFGHVKGAFSGAIRDKKGLVEEADDGTLFLDEVGDLSPAMQTKLLRFLQNGEIRAVGSLQTKAVNVRVVAATNKDLIELVKKGEFREDLYYRLNVIDIFLPPLRQRQEDIPILAHYFLEKHTRNTSKKISGFTSKAMALLLNREWPGNIRELENVVERAVIVCRGGEIDTKDLAPISPSSIQETRIDSSILDLPFKEAKQEALRKFYREYLSHVLSIYKGNVSKASSECGLKRQYFHRLMKIAGIEAKIFRKSSR